jgi:poly(3-hydroxybutyrate) depolymerase
MKSPRNDLPATRRWRAILVRAGAWLRGLRARMGFETPAEGSPASRTAPATATALGAEDVAPLRPPHAQPAPVAGHAAVVEPAAVSAAEAEASTAEENATNSDVNQPTTTDIDHDAPSSAPLDQPQTPPVRARRNRWQRETMHEVGGRIDLFPWVPPERTYRVFVPGTLSPDPCIVMMLHGCKQTPEDIAEGTRLNEHAEDLGWIVVYPEQSRAANKYGCWNWFDPANARGDGECALIMAIHAAVRARLKLNEPRSFLAGMSAGGALASLLALHYARHWAVVAIHSGLPYGAATDPWGAQRAMREGAHDLDAAAKLKARAVDTSPLPAVIMHGNEDAVVNRRNADLLVRQFLGWNGYFPEGSDWANAPLPPAVLTQQSTTYGHPYILRDFGEGLHPPVRECEVVGMGHAWSGGDSALPFHDEMGPDASALMMEFFATIAERG